MKAAFLLLLISLNVSGQIIHLHSISDQRSGMSFIHERGYTLDGMHMKHHRAKLLSENNFGGTYPKKIQITDDYALSGGLSKIGSATSIDILFVGSFFKSDPALAVFTSAELDSLLAWSLRGGKAIIASQPNILSHDLTIFNSRWGFELDYKAPSAIIPTEAGRKTLIFDGPFGKVGAVKQGGEAQGYFKVTPPGAVVFANNEEGWPTLVFDCRTYDLLVADVDAYTMLGQPSFDSSINNEQDKFWGNTIAFMDQLVREADPVVLKENCSLSTGNYEAYQWYFGENPVPGANSSTFKPVKSGLYKIQVTTKIGCKVFSNPVNYHIPVPPPLKDTTMCLNDTIRYDPGIADSYLWSTGESTRYINITLAGSYSVKLNSSGCEATAEFNVKTLSLPQPSFAPIYKICEKDSGSVFLDPGEFKKYKWWDDGDTLRIYTARKSKKYTVTVTDSNGCKASAEANVSSRCKTYFHIPNAFTPNADGRNDSFHVTVETPLEKFHMEIYNAWGEKIFESDSEYSGWDGTYNDSPAPQGVYYYYISYSGYTDKLKVTHKTLSGVVHLLR